MMKLRKRKTRLNNHDVTIRGVGEKVIFAAFMERLDSYKTLWQENRTSSDVTFNEFLLGVADVKVSKGISKTKIRLLQKLNNVVFKLVLLWRRTGTEKPFEEYLEEIRSRHAEKKKSKKEVKQEK